VAALAIDDAAHLRDAVRMAVRTATTRRGPKAERERVPTNLSLPRDLVAEVDAVAGDRGRSRFIEDATRYALRRERLRLAIQRTAGAWAGRDDLPPEWSTSEGVVAWVRALRAEETDPGPEG
jgi:hypothetical protein